MRDGNLTIFDFYHGGHKKTGLVKFAPFQIRQTHTQDDDTAFQDFSFLNAAGTATDDEWPTPQDYQNVSDNLRLVMIITRLQMTS